MHPDTQRLPTHFQGRRTRGLPSPMPWLSDRPKSASGIPQSPLVVPSAPPVPSDAEGEGTSVSIEPPPPVVVVATADSAWSKTIVQALR